MEPEGSLPSSQKLSTCTYPEPDQSSPQTEITYLLKFNKSYKTIMGNHRRENSCSTLRFAVFMVVAMKNAIFWDVTPCDSCKN
jgi:hypothetical protein